MQRSIRFRRWGSFACCAVVATATVAAQAQFTPGNVVVSVSGTNPTAGAPSISPLTLVEYTRSGIPTGFVQGLPSADTPAATGTNYAIVGTTQATALYGALKRSVDGRYLTITGANVPVATGTDALTFGVFSTATFPNRVIARIDAAGSVDTTTRFAARGATPNGVMTTDGTSMWWAADTGSSNSGGVRYLTLGSTVAGPQLTGIDLSPDSRTNTNGIGIFADQLYVAYNVNPFRGVYALGSGLQQTGGPLVATTVVSSTSVTDFFFANANTLYVAASNTNPSLPGLGLQKWVKSDGGSWTNAWAANPAETLGIRGIAGSVNGENIEIFGVTLASTSSAIPNSLLKVVDTLAGTSFPGFETLATSGSNSLFRGVAFAPVPEPVSLALGLAGLGVAFAQRAFRRRHTAARSRRHFARHGILLWAALGGAVAHGQFTPGSIVVSQYGDGVTTSGTVPITLREFTTSGSATGWQVTLPTSNSGSNYAAVGTLSTTGGFLKRSVNGQYLTIVGAGTETAKRTVARIDVSGTINTTTSYTAGIAGNTVYSAITTDGISIWLSADTGNNDTAGIRYLTLGSTTSGVRLSYGIGGSGTNAQGEYPIPLNTRVNGIFDNQMYGSALIGVGPSNSYSFRGVYNAGTGLETSGTLYGKTIVGGGISGGGPIDNPWEFVVVSNSTGRPSVIYVADDDSSGAVVTGGVQKWLFDSLSGTWSKVWTANVSSGTGMRALTALVTGNSVQLYGVTGTVTPTGRTSLVALSDTLDGTLAPTVTTLATADTNYVFRGVAFAPVPEPAAWALGLAGLATLGFAAGKAARRQRT